MMVRWGRAALNAVLIWISTHVNLTYLMRLTFDGSFRGGCGGAGAVLHCAEGNVHWQGARYLSNCASSAHAEFEGLIFGLSSAEEYSPVSLLVEGDCRVVIAQCSGRARARKLSKLNARAAATLERLPLQSLPAFGSISREDNFHADALSRAAVDATQALHGAAILASARGGKLQPALALVDDASRARVHLAPHVHAELLEACHAASEWQLLLRAYRNADDTGWWASASNHAGRLRAFDLASDALEAMGGTSRGSDPASRQLASLRRQQEEARRAHESVLQREATQRRASERAVGVTVGDDDEEEIAVVHDDERGGMTAVANDGSTAARAAAAATWHARLAQEAGGPEAMRGDDTSAVPQLLALVDALASERGLGWRL